MREMRIKSLLVCGTPLEIDLQFTDNTLIFTGNLTMQVL